MEHIGEKIRELRIQKRWTQKQLAQKISISRSNVSKWETNQIVPGIGTLSIIAKLFDKDINYFIK